MCKRLCMSKNESKTEKIKSFDQSFEFQLLKMLSDPMRTRIILELLVHEELSTKQLLKRIPIGRSTLGHHLQKLEEYDILTVRIQEKGYSVKFYSLSKTIQSKFSLKQALDSSDSITQSQLLIDAFSSLTGVLQFIANIAYESFMTLHLSNISNIHKNQSEVLYSVNGRENQFLPVSFNIIPKQLVPEFQILIHEFIEKSKCLITDDKPITDDNLPLYAFITAGFPILFFSGTQVQEESS